MSRRRQWAEDSTVKIDLSAGAQVTLAFRGNLFDLTGDERRLVGDLSTTIQMFRDKVNSAKADVEVRRDGLAGDVRVR
jgi:hypothetical protein